MYIGIGIGGKVLLLFSFFRRTDCIVSEFINESRPFERKHSFTPYLQIHHAMAEILHASVLAKVLDGFFGDSYCLEGLASDGSTNLSSLVEEPWRCFSISSFFWMDVNLSTDDIVNDLIFLLVENRNQKIAESINEISKDYMKTHIMNDAIVAVNKLLFHKDSEKTVNQIWTCWDLPPLDPTKTIRVIFSFGLVLYSSARNE